MDEIKHIRRGRPIVPGCMRQHKPWEKLGISRATWFRWVKLYGGHREAWKAGLMLGKTAAVKLGSGRVTTPAKGYGVNP